MANKIRKLQEKFIELDNTPPSTKKDRSKKDKINHKKGRNGKDQIVKRKNKTKSNSTKKKKNKLSKLRRKKKTTKNTRYYLENGKYKANKKFESWADNLEKMWKNVDTDDSCSCGVSAAKDRHRVVNGKEAEVHKFPWIISMMDGSDYYYCGGSIISDQWILTAAHCVDGEPNNPAEDMYVRVGDHDMTDDSDTPLAATFQVDYWLMHKNYDPDSTNNDIALLKLKKKIDFSSFKGTVAPVCLPTAPRKYYGETVTVSGWGLLSDGGKTPSKLQEVDLKVIWMKECREDFKYRKDMITSRMMCTYRLGSENQDACQGDSGGPLVRFSEERGRYEQVGVVSWGIGCASPEYPGIFVKLSHYLQWMMKKAGKSTFCSG